MFFCEETSAPLHNFLNIMLSSVEYNFSWISPNESLCPLGQKYFPLPKYSQSSRISAYSWKRFNKIIATTGSKYQPQRTTSLRLYHSLGWLDTAPENNKVTRNIRFTKVVCLLWWCKQFIKLNGILMIISHLQFKNIHLLVWKIQQNYCNNEIKISSSKNDRFTTLSLAHLPGDSTGN